MNLRLEQTCFACPEQYEVFDKSNKQVGYLRLRHGCFTVEYPECNGELLWRAYPDGDGQFTPEERYYYLIQAKRLILNRLLLEVK